MDKLFLDKECCDEAKKQLALKKVWEIASFLCPSKETNEARLRVESSYLLALGFVSEEAAGEIQQIRERKAKSTDEAEIPDEPKNEILVRNNGDSFTISKTYVKEEQYFASSDRLGEEDIMRKDTVVGEVITLSRLDNFYQMKMRIMEVISHLHAFGQTRFLREEAQGEPRENLGVEAEPTARDINRTLALLALGISQNCLDIFKG